MKRKSAGMAVAAVLVLASVVPMFAQHAGPIKVNVPFNFVVENEKMPAGEYTIQRIAAGRLMISGTNWKANVLAFPTQSSNTIEQGRLVFRRYGAEYFLSKIWTPGQETGWEVMQGKLENELAKRGVPVQRASITTH